VTAVREAPFAPKESAAHPANMEGNEAHPSATLPRLGGEVSLAHGVAEGRRAAATRGADPGVAGGDDRVGGGQRDRAQRLSDLLLADDAHGTLPAAGTPDPAVARARAARARAGLRRSDRHDPDRRF